MKTLDPTQHHEAVLAILDRSPLFHGLDAEHLEEAAGQAEVLAFEDGETLARQGEPSDCFFLLLGGAADVVLEDVGDEPLRLARLDPPDAVGEMGVLLEAHRTASVIAHGPVIALRFTAQRFHAMLLRLPYFGLVMARTLARRLQTANRQMPMPELGDPAERPDDEALTLLPAAFQIRHRVVPLHVDDDHVTLGCLDDLPPGVLGAIEQQLPGMRIRRVRITANLFEDVMRSRGAVGGFPAPDERAPGGGDGERPAAPRLDPLLRRMVAEGASDLHLGAGQVPRWRVDGALHALSDLGPLGPDEAVDLLDPVMTPGQRAAVEAGDPVDFAYDVPGLGRFRVALSPDVRGTSAVLRSVPAHVPTLAQIGLPPAAGRLVAPGAGLVLVSGPRGSGRTTTLAALIDHVDRTRPVHVVTLEDPVEFVHESRKALVTQRAVGPDLVDRLDALQATHRADADVVMVGPLDDAAITEAALRLAAGGVLVLGCVDARTAPGALERLVEQFDAPQQARVRSTLARVLRGVVAQALVPRVDGGRAAAFELLLADDAVAELVRDDRTARLPDAMRARAEAGHRLLNASLEGLVGAGRITAAAATMASPDPVDLGRRLKHAEG